ncbi:protein-O-mannosyltransferase-like protein [Kribbella orskensis]|uniref:Polyprenol-phosphate-mannose--protein mannosyltransferase n=2 Tax=Kribbellaceae TaxID=2726069 RepID=A0ABY2BDL5_9ACTN|nr:MULTISPECIES: phospholipid carrier-dependent glycosyltransferase [Kribbella]TCN35286.1 protein-O-mannosyltransferase-like protein [Kribbella sp. VKM Ac-2500]TCO16708.1 protein-O-mannosyltransferase-like protein [Kribbella orskensis]
MASVTAVIDDDTAKPAEAGTGADDQRETLGRDVLGRRLPPLKERLYPPMPRDFDGGWIATLAITAMAAILRFWNLGNPVKFVFDETYYAKDAYSLLKHGYALQFIDKPEGAADKAILAGNLDVFKDTPSLTVHPEVGKWMIAAGEQLFGMNTFGWRFMPALCGTLTVLLVIRTVRRMSRSTLIGCIAGVLLAVDGLHFVMSRVALLDVFLAFWLVAAVSCLVADRDWTRRRHANSLDKAGPEGLRGKVGRWLLIRPWRIAAGICFGLALGTKWSAVWVVAGFGILVFAWDLGARRALGVRHPFWKSVFVDGIPAFLSIVLVAVVTYTATWTGWLLHDNAYDHDYASKNPAHGVMKVVPDDFRSLIHYHQEVLAFHTGDYIKHATHPYSSHPAGWPIIARPIGFDAVNDIKPGTPGCNTTDGTKCLSVISALGTPLLWWGGALALIAALVLWIGQRDWRFGVPIVGYLTCWVPWFAFDDRPIFFFYAVTMIPFTVMALALALGKILGPARVAMQPSTPRRLIGSAVVGAFVVLVVLNFAYIWPILTDEVLPHPAWLSRMWFKSWI